MTKTMTILFYSRNEALNEIEKRRFHSAFPKLQSNGTYGIVLSSTTYHDVYFER